MKQLFWILVVSLTMASVSAQETSAGKPVFQVREGNQEFVDGGQNALTVDLPEVKGRTAEQIWKDYIDKFGGKTKKFKDIKGYKTEETEIYAIGGLQKMNVYARVDDDHDRVSLTAWFETPKGMLRSDTDLKAYQEAVKFLQEYALEVRIAQVEEELADEEKTLKGLERDMDRLKRDNDGYHKDIENAKDRIKKAEDNIVENEKAQVTTSEQIGTQNGKVDEVRERLKLLKK